MLCNRIVSVAAFLLCVTVCDVRAEEQHALRAVQLLGQGSSVLNISLAYSNHIAVGALADSWVLQTEKHDEFRQAYLDQLVLLSSQQVHAYKYLQSVMNWIISTPNSDEKLIRSGFQPKFALFESIDLQMKYLFKYIKSGDSQASQKWISEREKTTNFLQSLSGEK